MDRPKKPTALAPVSPSLTASAKVETTHDNSRVLATLPTGESVEILLYGATVISWKDGNGAEKLWLSEGAKLDGSKAVRGGIPLVFPVFGTAPDHEATKTLPQHGFARNSRWEFLGKSTSESASGPSASDSSVKLDFGLSSAQLTAENRAAWPVEFGLIYSVSLTREGLETSILVRNESETAFEFQTLLHTYLRVKDITTVAVTGLTNASYVDKVDNASTKTETNTSVTISGEVDRVYTPAPGSILSVTESDKKTFEVVRDNLDDVVVWNPWIEKAKGLGDFEPKDGYKNMICVEAGAVAGWQKLEAGDSFEGGQIIKAVL